MAEYCQHCEHSHSANGKRASRLWLCTQFKRRTNFSHVVEGEWALDEPYMRCAMINDYFVCPLFEPKEQKDGV